MQTKPCTRCKQVKAVGLFPTYPNGRPKSWCTECQTGYIRDKRRSGELKYSRKPGAARAASTPIQRRQWKLHQKFGITPAEYDALSERQQHCCAICGQPERKVIAGKAMPLSVDHDHTTGKVRGLLCHSCNIALGMLRDSPALLEKALDYLRYHDFP